MLVVVGDDEQNYVTTYINKILYCVRPRVHARRARRREQYYRMTYINSWIVSAYFIKTSSPSRDFVSMPRGQGYKIKRVSLGASRGVTINRLGRRARSPSDIGEGQIRQTPGIQHISNAQLPLQRQIDDQVQRAELQGVF